MRTTCPTYLILLDFITLIIFAAAYKLRSPWLCRHLQPPAISFILGPEAMNQNWKIWADLHALGSHDGLAATGLFGKETGCSHAGYLDSARRGQQRLCLRETVYVLRCPIRRVLLSGKQFNAQFTNRVVDRSTQMRCYLGTVQAAKWL